MKKNKMFKLTHNGENPSQVRFNPFLVFLKKPNSLLAEYLCQATKYYNL